MDFETVIQFREERVEMWRARTVVSAACRVVDGESLFLKIDSQQQLERHNNAYSIIVNLKMEGGHRKLFFGVVVHRFSTKHFCRQPSPVSDITNRIIPSFTSYHYH